MARVMNMADDVEADDDRHGDTHQVSVQCGRRQRHHQEQQRVPGSKRNGARDQLLATQAGDLEVRIPTLRKGWYFPLSLNPAGIAQALYAVVMEIYVCDVSTRSVDDLVAALGID